MNAVHRILNPEAPPQLADGLCALGVMTKAPLAGKVKTRLTPPLTPEEAAALNICFLRDTSAAILDAIAGLPARGIGIYTPVGQETVWAGVLPAEFELVPQRGHNFGDRLIFATQDLLGIGFEAVCLIDSDSPTVPQRAYSDAVAILARPGDQIVLGPSDDGGYYMIGMKNLHRRLFEDVDWSTERVAEQTLARAAELNLEVHLLPVWYDVDDRTTLIRLCDELLGPGRGNNAGFPAPGTRDYLTKIIDEKGRGRI